MAAPGWQMEGECQLAGQDQQLWTSASLAATGWPDLAAMSHRHVPSCNDMACKPNSSCLSSKDSDICVCVGAGHLSIVGVCLSMGVHDMWPWLYSVYACHVLVWRIVCTLSEL